MFATRKNRKQMLASNIYVKTTIGNQNKQGLGPRL